MEKTINKRRNVNSEKLIEYFNNNIKVENDRKSNRDRVMERQLHQATGGKFIVFSNNTGK